MTVDQCVQSIPLFLEALPLSKVLTSMPGVGVRTGARILIEVGDGTFPAGHPAPRAGLATATRSSGSSILASGPPGGETSSANGPSSSPPSRPWATCPRWPTTTGRSHRASTTHRPCSVSPDAGPTSSSQCSETEPSTNLAHPERCGGSQFRQRTPTSDGPPRRTLLPGRSSGAPHAHPEIGEPQRTVPSVRRARSPRNHQWTHHRHALAQYAHPLRPVPALCHRLIINIHGAHRSRRPETEPIHLDQRDGGPRGSSKAE